MRFLMKPRHDLFTEEVQGGHDAIVGNEPAAIYFRQDPVNAKLLLKRA